MFTRTLTILILLLTVTISSVNAIGEVTPTNQIAIIGTDYNIYTHNVASQTTTQLTDDADDTRRYQWVTWANDGRLAYFCCEFNPMQANNAQIYVSRDGTQPASLIRELDDTSIIYASWSPADCGTNCRNLAILANNLLTGGLSLELIEDNSANQTTVTDGVNSFYFDWASTGDQFIYQQNNFDLGVYAVAQADTSQTFDASSGRYQTPQWSPVDNRIAIGLTGDANASTNLTIIEADGTQNTLARDLADFVSFLWSPDGAKIAYRTIDQFGFNTIVVVDANTGEELSRSTTTGVIAFFWSPDSTQIAFVTFQAPNSNQSARNHTSNSLSKPIQRVQNENPTVLTWHILDIEANTDLRYSSFIPTVEMIYILNYFDQFASSHRVWSPDSEAIVFSGFFAESQPNPIVYTLDVSSNGNDPEFVAEGVLGVWSFE